MTKDNGGPAFPTDGFKYDSREVPNREGMTLRDYFAGQALMGLVAFDRPNTEGNKPEHFSRWSYAIADAMLAERAK